MTTILENTNGVRITEDYTPSELYLRSRVADLLHLLRGADIQCPTAGDNAQVATVIGELAARLKLSD